MGIYTRLSRDRDGTQTATARQAADCRALADREGWTVVAVYEDTDLSGSKRGLVRPDYERMVEDLRGGRIAAVVVWKLDRLSRQPGQFETVVTACEAAGARIVSVHEAADMTSPAGLAMMRVGMAFAALETDTMSLRIRRQKAEDADAGLPNAGGIRAFGHAISKREIIPAEADLIREAAARVIAGETRGRIVRDWHQRGLLTTRGNPWTVTTLTKLLTSPRLIGCRTHHERVIPSPHIPPILEKDTFDQVCAVIEAGVQGRGAHSRRASRALSSLVRCARCRQPMTVNYRSDRQVLYRCEKRAGGSGCGRMVISAHPVEEIVGAALADTLDVQRLTERAVQADSGASDAARRLLSLTAQREQLVQDHYVTGLVSRGDFLAAHERIGAAIAAAERAIADAGKRNVLLDLGPGESVGDAWDTRGHGWRRALAASCLEHVLIHPAPRRGSTVVDPARVELVWRQ